LTSRWWAPARVNLIGEHIDYCGGRVLPMPIQFGTTVTASRHDGRRIVATSRNQSAAVEFAIGTRPSLPAGHWGWYVVGAVAVLQSIVDVDGLQFDVEGDIPASGLSSSASLSTALLAAGADALGVELSGLDLALAAQRIEHDHVGVACGLMDQAVIASGVRGAAYLFDCRTLSGRSIALPADMPSIWVIDSGKPRALVNSAYNNRRRETTAAAAALGCAKDRLADASVDEVDRLPGVLRKRARHVIGEQRRVADALAAIDGHDWIRFGALLIDSHRSLRDDFEVSCEELDCLVELLVASPGCLGARMTGAGFGGAVVALMENGANPVSLDGYRAVSGRIARAFEVRSFGGVQRRHG